MQNNQYFDRQKEQVERCICAGNPSKVSILTPAVSKIEYVKFEVPRSLVPIYFILFVYFLVWLW